MIVCVNCSHANMAGAVFCAECGASLLAGTDPSTREISRDGDRGRPEPRLDTVPNSTPPPMPPAGLADNWLTLHMLDTGQLLPLTERSEFTLGRISDGQPIMPDIDLSPYQAYANGVSRLHAIIKRGSDSVALMDLGSANGTFLNGKRLSPNVERELANGDVVALGRLKIQVLLKQA